MPTPVEFVQTFKDEPERTDSGFSGTVGYRAIFKASDVGTMSASDVFNHPKCPKIWASVHPDDSYAVATSISPVRNEEVQHIVDITVQYNYVLGSLDSKGKPQSDNPTKHRPQIEMRTWTKTKPVLTWRPLGINAGPVSAPITTTAGERIIITETFYYRQFNCSLFVTKADPIFINNGSWVNSDSVTIEGVRFDRLTLKATNVEFGKVEVRNGYLGREMTYTIQHNPDTWITKAENVGFHQIKYTPVTGVNGKLDLRLGYQPIEVGLPSSITSQPILLLNMPARQAAIRPMPAAPVPPPIAAAFDPAVYNQFCSYAPSVAPQGYTGGGVTNGDFYHGHAHPAFLRTNDKGDPIDAHPTAAEIAAMYEENRLEGLIYPELAFNQFFKF